MTVLEAREAHPRWGPRTIEQFLRRRLGDKTPSERTIARILKRANLVKSRRRRPLPNVVERAPEVEATAPNDVWTIDFKGWWRTRDGARCEPLTVRDAYSRYLLAVDICSTKTADARKTLDRLFRKHGIPRAIQCDNGVPFVAVNARAGLSALSAWWTALGIRIVRSRPGCPQDNGAHERMHRDLKSDVQKHPASSTAAQQRDIDRWRQEFNHVRPHQALGGKTPAETYKPTERRPPVVREPNYGPFRRSAAIGATGCFKLRGELYFVSGSLHRMRVGLESIDDTHLRVWFHELDLGVIEVLPRVAAHCFDPWKMKKTKRNKRAA